MNMFSIAATLKRKNLRLTDSRKEVLLVLQQTASPLSLSELEAALPAMDRITMYRTLQCFRENNLLHIIADPSSGGVQYMFTDPDAPQHHAHFKCSSCSKIICLDKINPPAQTFELPDGFEATTYSLMIEGLCTKCQL
jgi:Fur family ferric uptake transcriptional regulator